MHVHFKQVFTSNIYFSFHDVGCISSGNLSLQQVKQQVDLGKERQ